MRVGCVICGDLFVVADDVSATPCGHTFHSVCLIQWIERSKSCPQCRHKTTEKSILKLFFDSSGADNSQVDPDTLQLQIDNLKFQVRLKDQEISKMKDDNKLLSKQTKALREECKTIQKQLKDKDTTMIALKSQLHYMDQMKIETMSAKETAKKLQIQLSVLQNVQTIMSGTSEDVESMLMSYNNDGESIRSLATFCSILKKELNKTADDKKRFRDETSSLRAKLKEIRHKYNSSASQLNTFEQTIKLLQDDIHSLEKENKNLKKKVNALQDAIASPSGNVKNSALHRLIAESPAPAALKRSQPEDEVCVVTPEVVRNMAQQELDDSIQFICTPSLEECSPQRKKITLPGRKPFAVTTNIPRTNTSSHNIFAKSKSSQKCLGENEPSSSSSLCDDVGYDGLGGHHKVDEFPQPKPVVFAHKKTSAKAFKKAVKVVSKSGFGSTVQKTTLKNYFQNTFDDL